MKKEISRLEGTYTIAGTMIGAGILALPSSMAISGFLPGMLAIALIGVLSILTALYIIETTFRTEGDLHMPALAEAYLGKPGMLVIFLGILVYTYGALSGYLSAGGNLIHELSGGAVPYWMGTTLYFAFSSAVVYFGLHITGVVELVLFSLMILFIVIIALFAFPHAEPQLLVDSDWGKLPSIFGVVLFAYAGHVVIPSVAHGMKHDKKGLVLVTIGGLLVPMIIYLFWSLIFTLVIPRGIEGEVVAYSETVTLFQARYYGQPATIPMGHLIGGTVVLIGSIFAILSTFTSYLGFGISLTDCWMDMANSYKRPMQRKIAIVLALLAPLVLALGNPASFLAGIDIAGMYGGSLFAGILPPIMVLKARKAGSLESGFTVPGGSLVPLLVLAFFLAGLFLRTWQLLSSG